MKQESRIKQLRILAMPFVIGIWMGGWALYCMGDKPTGRLERWLEKVARGKW